MTKSKISVAEGTHFTYFCLSYISIAGWKQVPAFDKPLGVPAGSRAAILNIVSHRARGKTDMVTVTLPLRAFTFSSQRNYLPHRIPSAQGTTTLPCTKKENLQTTIMTTAGALFTKYILPSPNNITFKCSEFYFDLYTNVISWYNLQQCIKFRKFLYYVIINLVYIL